jgi:bifunctional non-homologous end joining protein LigD
MSKKNLKVEVSKILDMVKDTGIVPIVTGAKGHEMINKAIEEEFMKKVAMMGGGDLIEEPPVERWRKDLGFTGGGSDKVYQVWITEEPGGFFNINTAYGRRGTSLNYSVKTSKNKLENAIKSAETIIAQKLRKGYKVEHTSTGGTAEASSISVPEKKTIEHLPQLLNPQKDEAKLEVLLDNPDWVMMPKHDGKRRIFEKKDSEVTPANRKGEVVALDNSMLDAVKKFPMDHVVLDGEDMGDTFICFDMIIYGVPLSARIEILKNAFKEISRMKKITLTEMWFTAEDKRKAFKELKEKGQEGVVFRKLSSLYTAGRPASGGEAIKFKFVETASFIVTSIHPEKESIGIGLFNDAFEMTEVGNATVYANIDKPKVGDIVEVEYLYAFREGSVFQPVLLGTRDDITAADCTTNQLKYKKES